MTTPGPVGTIDQQIAQVTDQFLREAAYTLSSIGYPPQPVVYMFGDGEYNGWVGCRPYSTESRSLHDDVDIARDLHNAIAGMAWIPAARNADRLMIGWEDFALRTNLTGPGEYMRAFIVADVPLIGPHTLTWWPFTLTDVGESSELAATLEWLPESTGQEKGRRLPPPMVQLIATWRANRQRLDEDAAVADALENDYMVSLI